MTLIRIDSERTFTVKTVKRAECIVNKKTKNNFI